MINRTEFEWEWKTVPFPMEKDATAFYDLEKKLV